MVSYVTPGGTITLDANLDDWYEISPLKIHRPGISQYDVQDFTLYATTSDTHFVFALDASRVPGGLEFPEPGWATYRPHLMFDADLDALTGTKYLGWESMDFNRWPVLPYLRAEGIDFRLSFIDRVPKLFTSGVPELFISGEQVNADIQYSWNANVIEFSIERSAFGDSAEAMRVQLLSSQGPYIKDGPAYWWTDGILHTIHSSDVHYGRPYYPPQAYFGASGDIALDGSSEDWTTADRLDSPANGIDGFAVFGKATEQAYVFAIQSPLAIGQNTTIWLNTDNDASTGYQIWGWAGGAEYNVNFDASGTPRLYGINQVDDLAFAYSEDKTFIELIIPKALIGAPAQVNALLDINDLTFLPTQYAETQYEIVDPYSDLMLA
jgi:serralysin